MKTVLLVDDDEDLLNAICDVMQSFAEISCLKANSLESVQAQSDRLKNCDLAILDINLGLDRPDGLDVYSWLLEREFKGKIVFFTGHASNHPLVLKAKNLQGVEVYEKPLPLQNILAWVS